MIDAIVSPPTSLPGQAIPLHDQRLPDWFWDLMEVVDECWCWRGPISSSGYAIRGAGGRIRVHRLAYETVVRPIPDGWEPDHLCRNRRCVNPAHIEAVTKVINIMRGNNACALNARKTHCKHGHALAGENLRITTRGHRSCRECERRNARERYREGRRDLSP